MQPEQRKGAASEVDRFLEAEGVEREGSAPGEDQIPHAGEHPVSNPRLVGDFGFEIRAIEFPAVDRPVLPGPFDALPPSARAEQAMEVYRRNSGQGEQYG